MSQINVNNIRAKDGVGPVGFPGGINATGVVTATTFKGALEGNVTGTASNATVAEGLTGTPNITVGTVTGTDATFSGNLTVNGTTTTIDTAVTAVDSLAVDGQITGLGNCGIGTNNPGSRLHVMGDSGASGVIYLSDGDTPSVGDSLLIGKSGTTTTIKDRQSGSKIDFGTSDSICLTLDQHGTTKFKGPLTEKARYEGVTLNGDYNHDLITYGNVLWSDTAAAGAFTLNLRGSATVDLNDMMDTGESLSFWFAHACHSTTSHYMTAFKVDGTTISGTDILWSGGSAPTSAGGGSGTKDVYAFTVFKTANATFRAFASVTNHG